MNRNQHQHPARNRRGAALVLIAVMLPVLLGFAVLSVDVGYLVNVRIELQNVADAAALAGASGLPVGPDTVVERAKEYAAKHLGLAVPMLQNGDIQLGKWDSDTATFIPVSNPDEERADAVRVTALMSAERGNAVPLFFAGIFGKSRTRAAAAATATFGTGDTWDVMIVQDISGSFTGALASARTADESLIECLKDHTDNASRVGLVAFTGTARLLHPLEEIETGFDSLIQTVQDLESCCWFFCGSRPKCASGTNIADGLNVAVDEFLAAPPPDPDIGQAIVLVSDGRPQAGTEPGMTDAELRELALQAADDAWNEGIAIYTVYYGGSSSTPVEDAEYLEGLTRGRGTFSSTPDPDKLTTLVWRVCASLPLMLVE